MTQATHTFNQEDEGQGGRKSTVCLHPTLQTATAMPDPRRGRRRPFADAPSPAQVVEGRETKQPSEFAAPRQQTAGGRGGATSGARGRLSRDPHL